MWLNNAMFIGIRHFVFSVSVLCCYTVVLVLHNMILGVRRHAALQVACPDLLLACKPLQVSSSQPVEIHGTHI